MDKFDLDGISGKEDPLLTYLDRFRYVGLKDIPQEFVTESFSLNVKFLEKYYGRNYTCGIFVANCKNCKYYSPSCDCCPLFVSNYTNIHLDYFGKIILDT